MHMTTQSKTECQRDKPQKNVNKIKFTGGDVDLIKT